MRKALIAVILAASLLTPIWSFFLADPWNEPTADSGCGFDPWGRCNPAPPPETDSGCGMDPWGCPGS
jgi:hypothetical protein